MLSNVLNVSESNRKYSLKFGKKEKENTCKEVKKKKKSLVCSFCIDLFFLVISSR